jgi:peptidoglycan-associated lipoprotein
VIITNSQEKTMRHLRTFAVAAAALAALSACSKKAPETAPAPVNADSVAQAHAADSAAQAQVAAAAAAAAAKRRADSIANAPAAAAAAKAAALRAEIATTVYFEYDKSVLTDSGKKLLDRKIAILNANPAVQIQIEGHTDERGSSEYNVALGQQRAASVKRYLVQHGITDARITIISYGEEKPAANGHDETSWSQNRRAEFVITVEGLTNTP